MRRRVGALLVAVVFLNGAGCDGILGISRRGVADPGAPDSSVASSSMDGSAPSPEGSTPAPLPFDQLQCVEAGTCIYGGIFSVGQVPSASDAASVLPDGAAVTVVDDGFEFGNIVCSDGGPDVGTCVTGALSQ